MPDGSALRKEFSSTSHLATRLGGGGAGMNRETIATELRNRDELANLWKLVEEERNEQAEIAALIGEPAPDDLDADWLTSRAQTLREKAKGFAETLRPVIGLLKSLLSPGRTPEPETERLVRDSIQVLEAYPVLYRQLSTSLLKQAAERRAAAGEILRARPVKGEIDHEALSREFMARFPKIRAALAK